MYDISIDAAELNRRLAFLGASDALKTIERANTITSGERQENVAEHSWHLSLMSLLFADAAPPETDHHHVRDLLIVHDLVEVFAGDTVIWDTTPEAAIRERETAAAERLFGMLTAAEAMRMQRLWQEFDQQHTIEARFARALDALHPMLMSWGPTSAGHPIAAELTASRVLKRKHQWLAEFPDLWRIAQHIVQSAVDRGLLAPDPE